MALDDSTLVAYVDGELDAAAMHSVARALERDPVAQEKVRLLRQSASLISAVFRDPAYKAVPPGLAAEVMAPRGAWKTRARGWRLALPVAASIAAAAILYGGYSVGFSQRQQTLNFSERLLDEVADYHVIYAREDEHQVEVPAQRLAHIEAWLGARLHRRIQVPDLTKDGLTFEGARLLVVDGEPVAQLVYRPANQPQHPLALCISFGAPGEEAINTDSRNGVNLALWRRNGYTYVLVGWADRPFLIRLANKLAPQLDAI
jgi:anti-sigma factor RsiW